jgi:hypothetical protein
MMHLPFFIYAGHASCPLGSQKRRATKTSKVARPDSPIATFFFGLRFLSICQRWVLLAEFPAEQLPEAFFEE